MSCRQKMARLHVILLGLGPPNTDHKEALLGKLLKRLPKDDCTITVFVHHGHTLAPQTIRPIEERVSSGTVGQVLYELRLDPGTERVLLLLDDVEFLTDVTEFITEAETLLSPHEDVIVQPMLSANSRFTFPHTLATSATTDQVRVSICGVQLQKWQSPSQVCASEARNFEMFAYYMSASSFHRYQRLMITEETRCMWGIDFVIPHLFTCLYLRRHVIRHWHKGGLARTLTYKVCNEEFTRVLKAHQKTLLQSDPGARSHAAHSAPRASSPPTRSTR